LKPLILFAGPEGSGKTTLGLSLKRILENNGYKVKVVRIRGTHTLAYLLAMFLKKVLKLHGEDLHYYKVWIPKHLEKLWLLIEFISTIPLIFLYYYLYRVSFVVISERSLVDLVAWVLGGLKSRKDIVKSLFFRTMLIFALKYKPLYITANVNDLIKRKYCEKDLILNLIPYYEMLQRILALKCINTSNYTINECLTILSQDYGWF
jgi:energy-coupling factor transporter ATP-binding protein EcfA2